MTEEQFNVIIEERISLFSSYISRLNKIKSFDGIKNFQNILKNLYDDDFAFRKKHNLYDDNIKEKIANTEDSLIQLESIKNVKKLQQKTPDFWNILKDFKSHMVDLRSSLVCRVGLEEFLLEKPRD